MPRNLLINTTEECKMPLFNNTEKPLELDNYQLEFVKFQKKLKYQPLITIVESLSNHIKTVEAMDDKDQKYYGSKLNVVIRNLFGLNYKIVFSDKTMAAVSGTFSHSRSTLEHDFNFGRKDIKRNTEKISRAASDQKKVISLYEIDLENAMVLKSPLEEDGTIYLDPVFLVNVAKLTPSEITAAIVHEIGHTFTYITTSTAMIRVSQAVQNAIRDSRGMNEGQINVVIANTLTEADILSKEDLSKLNARGQINSAPLLSKIVGNVGSLMTGDKFAEVESEHSADIFAARVGFGKELVGALHKISEYGRKLNSGPFLTKKLWAVLNLLFVFLPGLLITILAWFIIGYAFGFVLGTILNPMVPWVHDKDRSRFQRVLNQEVQLLKQSDLTKADKKAALKTIEEINRKITDDDEVKLLKEIGVLLGTPAGRQRDGARIQQRLENLVANPLFVYSTKLEILT